MNEHPELVAKMVEKWTNEETQQEQPDQIESQEVEEAPASPAPQEVQESAQAKNFREIKMKAARIERERDELARKLQEIESSRNAQPVVEEDEDIRLAPDDIAEGKHLNKFDKKIKRLEDQIRRYEQRTSESSIESSLKSQYPDFDKVVSKENIDSLRNEYPELANTINSSNDLYSKAVSAYTIIKKLGIHKDQKHIEEVERAQKNVSKPRPLASVSPQQGDSPLSKANAFANGLTDELKNQLFKEMMEIRKLH